MSAQRQKGTSWEVELRDRLRLLFYPCIPTDHEDHPLQRVDEVARHRRAVAGDFVGVPFDIEAKSTKRPMFQDWARKMEKKVGKAWALVWHGDRRAKTGSGPYVIMPLEMFEWMTHGYDDTIEIPGAGIRVGSTFLMDQEGLDDLRGFYHG